MGRNNRFINYVSVCMIVIAVTLSITTALNYFLSDKKSSFSSKCAEINYVEYTDKSTYNLKFTRSSSWKEEDLNGYIFTIDITNITSDDIDNLRLELDFDQSIVLEKGSNGNFSSTDTTVTITPNSDNAVISASDTSTYDFVVYSQDEISVENIVIDFKESTYKLQNRLTFNK